MTNRKKEVNEEVFLPVKRSGKEVSIVELLQEMKEEERKRNRKNTEPAKGKHSGSESFREGEINRCGLSDIDLPSSIRNKELKKKRYRKKSRAAVLFCVDGSRSQGSKERLAFAKGAVMAILEKSYSERDRVAMILFGNSRADLVLPYTKSVDFAAERLKNLSAKGNTPLSMAMRLSAATVEQDRKKNKEDIHLVVLLTDGKSNFDVEDGKNRELTIRAAELLKEKNIPVLIIDTENSVFSMGLAEQIADKSGAVYARI